MMADRALTRLTKDFPGIEVERVDILSHPGLAWQAGIRLIPALKSGDQLLSGIFLTEKDIRQFLEEVASSTEK